MNSHNNQPMTVLGLHPMTFGIGWIFFESEKRPLDWAIIRSSQHPICLKRTELLMRRYAPAILVLEQFDRGPTRKVARIQSLCRSVLKIAKAKGVESRVYSRAAILGCFVGTGAIHRYQIAQEIAARFEGLRPKLPRRRKFPMDQDPRIAIFNAAACALTHYAAAKRPTPRVAPEHPEASE